MVQQQGWGLNTPAQCLCLVSGSYRQKPLIKTNSGLYKSLCQSQTVTGPHSSWSALEKQAVFNQVCLKSLFSTYYRKGFC